MYINIQLKGPLARHASDGRLLLTVEGPVYIKEVLMILGVEEKHVGLMAVNGARAYLDTQLEDGDHLVIFPVVAGG